MPYNDDESFWIPNDLSIAEADLDRLRERLADAERVVDAVIRGRDLCNENGIKIGAIFLSRIMNAESYRQKYPEVK